MNTKPAVPAEPRPAPVEDIRSGRPYLLSRTTLLAVARRLASVAALVTLDLAGLVLGVWVALVFRELYLGDWPPLWGIVWETESEWLPFLTVITVLVFWVDGLYRRRELRAHAHRPERPENAFTFDLRKPRFATIDATVYDSQFGISRMNKLQPSRVS